ncbi:SDR family oxidoreductase [Tsukamurella tyrosinosolvens]|uniref:SDR family oxidoreductase n=1 Tax=Tsukamurella tyrosinosolvens TaxID=57704 RepID=UPI000791AE1A|nr:SDR family oxidoreductase [Tsukamurella tyrosinosolvens]KXP07260.1 NAD-dependent epimerase [Tsukamurella tyrosinosolvens]KZL98461.1 NAD-dependent epimerase [Tsukamurella tyrosinosolvens]MCA4994648.1 SDR family oxidoreductase [Tsukamurella tyrosinosolvens]WEL92636.1 SDR family oxidoreductase [Tsukamurella tyrosinosolvens]
MSMYVVTGAASGLGAATAERLHAAGHGVIGVDLRGTDVEADLGTPGGRFEAVARIGELVGSAPLAGFAAFAGLGPAAGRSGSSVVAVNYFGAVDLLVGLRPLLARGPSAALLVSSNSTTTQPGWPLELAETCLGGDEHAAADLADSYGEYASILAYPATKAALAYFVRTHAAEYVRQGIRLNAIAPGLIDTPMTQAGRADPQLGAAMDAFLELIPAGRAGRPEEIAALAQFLLGPESGYCVGSVVFADGGLDAQQRPTDWPRPASPPEQE